MAISSSQNAILKLLADGKFHSGSELADALGVSRSAVWKQLSGLTTLGLEYSAISGKGYRLDYPLELLDQGQILALLGKTARQNLASLEIFDCIPSTNTYLLERNQNQCPSGSVCMAELQSAGRGRRGRSWVSPFGSNIYLSVLWRFAYGPSTLSGLSLVVGVAVIRALRSLYPYDFKLKWPNDIVYQDEKLAGILIEVNGETEGPCKAVIGLGLNLYLSNRSAQQVNRSWTDLRKITGHVIKQRNELAAALLENLFSVITEFEATGMMDLLVEWRNYDCLKGKMATLYSGQQQLSGLVQGIDDQGLLLMAMPDGMTKAFASGEVSFSGDGA